MITATTGEQKLTARDGDVENAMDATNERSRIRNGRSAVTKKNDCTGQVGEFDRIGIESVRVDRRISVAEPNHLIGVLDMVTAAVGSSWQRRSAKILTHKRPASVREWER